MASAVSTSEAAVGDLTGILVATIVASVRSDNANLRLQQLAVFLNTKLERDIEKTARALVAALKISKPASTRALGRQSAFGLIKRDRDGIDRRRVMVGRTSAGAACFRTLDGCLAEAAQT